MRHLTSLTPTVRFDPSSVRITEQEILADLRYPARLPAAVPARKARRRRAGR